MKKISIRKKWTVEKEDFPDLINWSEPSKTESRTRIRVLRLSDSRTDPTQKGGLRDVELSGDRLHPPLVSLFLQQTHRSRVSLKGRVSERVDLIMIMKSTVMI